MTHFEHFCSVCQQAVLVSPVNSRCPQCGAEREEDGREEDGRLEDGRLGEVRQDEGLDCTQVLSETTQQPALRSGSRDRGAVDLRETLIGGELDVYAINSFLGRGGMAWVFLAEHRNLARPCAVKVLCPELLGRKRDSVDLFIAEARAAASVVHPHIVTVHNVGCDKGHNYIELEYVPGTSLQGLLEQGELGVLQVTELMTQASAVLAEAHRSGLVHRDFKPANIMVREDGLAKLSDFGLAKRLADVGGRQGLAGTPFFMAPELFQGQAASKASDVYAVGVSLFQLLSGQYPFKHRQWTEVAKLHVEAPPPDIRERQPRISDALAALLNRCLAKDPAARPADGGELHARLQAVYRSLRCLRTLAAEAFEGLDLDWRMVDERVEVLVRLAQGRRQRVTIEETRCGLRSTPLVRIYSVCAPVREDYLRPALELNARIPHGALAVQSLDGKPHFVILNSYPRATCDVEELRHSVLDVAYWGDEVERVLTNEDNH